MFRLKQGKNLLDKWQNLQINCNCNFYFDGKGWNCYHQNTALRRTKQLNCVGVNAVSAMAWVHICNCTVEGKVQDHTEKCELDNYNYLDVQLGVHNKYYRVHYCSNLRFNWTPADQLERTEERPHVHLLIPLSHHLSIGQSPSCVLTLHIASSDSTWVASFRFSSCTNNAGRKCLSVS